METFSVSLLVHSSSLSLDDLSLKLRRTYSSGSHTKGEPHVLKERPSWSKTVWRLDSGVSENAAVDEHLENLKVEFPPSELKTLLPEDCTVCLDIAIFFDTVNVGTSISRRAMEIIDAYEADLEVTCYPSWAPLEKKRKGSKSATRRV